MTEHIKISRSLMIEYLSQSMFDDIEMNMEKLEDIINNGFKGYENYTNEELLEEYRWYVSEDPEYDVLIELEV